MCACRPDDSCGPGTNTGWGFDGCPGGGRRRRVQRAKYFANHSTALGRKLRRKAALLGNNTFMQTKLKLPSTQELEDTDCALWEVDKRSNNSICVHHRHTFWRAHAAQIRLQALLDHPATQLLWELNGQSDAQVPEDYPYSTSAAARGNFLSKSPQPQRMRKNWGSASVTSMTTTLANSINTISSFFGDMTNVDIFVIHYFELQGSSLGDLIDFNNANIMLNMSAAYFPGTAIAGVWSPAFSISFNPAAVFASIKADVQSFAQNFLSQHLDLDAMATALGRRRAERRRLQHETGVYGPEPDFSRDELAHILADIVHEIESTRKQSSTSDPA